MKTNKLSAFIRNFSIRKHHFFIFLIVGYVFLYAFLAKNTTFYPYGDGPEYIMMTESIYNHGSPEIRKEDPEKYLNYLNKRNIPIHREGDFINYLRKFETNRPHLKGYYQSTTDLDKWFSYHFWFYSLLNVPARYYLELIDGDIQTSFLATNLLLIFFCVWFIFNMKNLQKKDKVLLSLFLFLSPILWYIDWSHAEVYNGVLAFLGSLLFYKKRYYLAILVFALASLQNQTLAIICLFTSFLVLKKEGVSLRSILRLIFCNIWALIPSIFYYYWFKVGSLLAVDGTLSTKVISLKRFWHFFFDLNQGLMYGIPLILLFIIIFIATDLIKKKSLQLYLILLTVPLMSLFFMQVTNWNAGQVVMKRYGVWIAPLFIIPLYFRLKQLNRYSFYFLLTLCFTSQAFALFTQHDFSNKFWHANHLKPIANWVLDNHPSWYNPEAEVLLERLDPFSLSSTDSVRTYVRDDSTITKFIIKKGAIQQFLYRGVSSKTVDSLKENLCYFGGYAQINFEDFKKIGYNQTNDQYIPIIEQDKLEKKKQYFKEQIYSNPEWLEGIRNQSIEWGVSLEEAISINIDYLIETSN